MPLLFTVLLRGRRWEGRVGRGWEVDCRVFIVTYPSSQEHYFIGVLTQVKVPPVPHCWRSGHLMFAKGFGRPLFGI